MISGINCSVMIWRHASATLYIFRSTNRTTARPIYPQGVQSTADMPACSAQGAPAAHAPPRLRRYTTRAGPPDAASDFDATSPFSTGVFLYIAAARSCVVRPKGAHGRIPSLGVLRHACAIHMDRFPTGRAIGERTAQRPRQPQRGIYNKASCAGTAA